MSDMGLTAMQLETLAFITNYIDGNGIPPSFDEIKDGLGLRSKSGIFRLVNALEERGKIHRLHNRARAIALGPAPVQRCPSCQAILDYVHGPALQTSRRRVALHETHRTTRHCRR